MTAQLVLHLALAGNNKVERTIRYEPKECNLRVENGDKLRIHYTGTIDESSATGAFPLGPSSFITDLFQSI
jgi:hypothetical protein